MRAIRVGIAAVSAVSAVVLLAGCGGGKDDDGGKGGSDTGAKSGAAASGTPDGGPEDGAEPAAGKWGPPEEHEVTLELGDFGAGGQSQVMWNAGSMHTEQVTVPWKKTVKVTLKGAEQKVGTTVSVVPQGIKNKDGMLVLPPCTISVDGKKVVRTEGGEERGPQCQYKLKGDKY